MKFRTKKKVDNKIFRKTQRRTKLINVAPITFRGGIRL